MADNKYRDRHQNNKNFKSKKYNTFDMFNINVDKAKKDSEVVFNTAKKNVVDYNDYSLKSSSKTLKGIANINITTYNKIYSELSSMHESYLNNMIQDEYKVIKDISSKWSSINRGSTNTNNSRVTYDQNSQIVSNSHKSNNKDSSYNNDNASEFMKSLDKSLKLITDKYSDSGIDNILKSQSDSNDKNNENFLSNGTKLIKSMTSGAHDVLEKFTNIWIKRFTTGIDKVSGVYEQTYQKVSVIMNYDQVAYMAWQDQTMNSIKTLGLTNNIAISEVMSQLSDLTSRGLEGDKANNLALVNTISKIISPYVDVTTSAYTDLQLKLGDEFITSIRGMGESVSDQVGQQRLFSSSINTIIDMLNPIMLNSKADYADKYLGEVMTGLEGVVANGVLTQDQALQLAYDVSNASADWYKAITSDNIPIRIAASTVDDPSNIASMMKGVLDSTNDIFKGVDGLREQSVVTNVIGTSGWLGQLTDINKLGESYLDSIENYSSSYDSGLELLTNLSDDQYNTALQTKEILSENSMLDVAQFKQKYPDAYLIMSDSLDILKGILGSVVAIATKPLINSLLGKSGLDIKGLNIPNLINKSADKASAETVTKALGSASIGGIGLTSILGATAGVGIAGYGGYNSYQQFKAMSDKSKTDKESKESRNAGIGYAGSAIAGATGAGLLLASNPVGWAVLALGGIALGATEVYKASRKQSKLVSEVSEKYQDQIDTMRQEQAVREDQIKLIKDSNDLETKKDSIVEIGIVDEEDVADMTSLEIDAKINSYEQNLKDIEQSAEDYLAQYTKIQKESVSGIAKDNADAIYKALFSSDSNISDEDLLSVLSSLGLDTNKLTDKSYLSNYAKGADYLNIGTETTKMLKDAAKDPSKYTKELAAYFYGSDITHSNTNLVKDRASKLTPEDYQILLDKYSLEGVSSVPTYDAELYADIAQSKAFLDINKDIKDQLSTVDLDKYNEYKEFLLGQIDPLTGKSFTLEGYKTGTPYLATDRIIQAHEGEAVLNKEDNKEYMKVVSSIPVISNILSSPLFKKSTETTDVDDKDISREDMINKIDSGINNLVDAIVSLKRYTNEDKSFNKNGIADRISSSYDSNLINLSASMSTHR